MNRRDAADMLLTLGQLSPEIARGVLAGLYPLAIAAIREEWWWQAHGGQIEPETAWRVWAIIAGRGFGKTRAGAEWVAQRAREHRDARIALVAASLEEVARVMVEGESGLLELARSNEEPRWIASRGLLLFPSGARGYAYTAERPGQLRGPQHHFAWCDELAKWPNGDDTWNNLMLGLRLGVAPRTIVTTTPKPGTLLKRILGLSRTARTEGRTDENPHLPADFRSAMTELFGGTRLGRQELEGVLFDEIAGALWTRELLDKGRAPAILPCKGSGTVRRSGAEADGGGVSTFGSDNAAGALPLRLTFGEPPPRSGEDLQRIVIGVDPPAGTVGDACGIVVCGMARDGIAYVLADHTASGLSPNSWAGRVADAAALWGASLIVAEKNQGGDMVGAVLRAADADLPVRLVSATTAKPARAEPIALHFETGRARLAGAFPELEDELCALTHAGYEGANRSPDRADAMVWAMSALFGGRGEPGIRRL